MARNNMQKNDRFQVIYEQSGFLREYDILEDTQTGMRYLFVKDGYGAGITPLLDEKGNPDIRRTDNDESTRR